MLWQLTLASPDSIGLLSMYCLSDTEACRWQKTFAIFMGPSTLALRNFVLGSKSPVEVNSTPGSGSLRCRDRSDRRRSMVDP